MTADRRVFRLFACNVPVAGARRAILCDLQRGDYYRIPIELYPLLAAPGGVTVDAIRAAGAEAAIAQLVDAELGFWADSPEEVACFPPIDLTYARPETLTGAIVDADALSRHASSSASTTRSLSTTSTRSWRTRRAAACARSRSSRRPHPTGPWRRSSG
jgi:hypothetical protein